MDCVKYVSGTKLDERIIRCDIDPGFKDGRQFGRGKSGGQVKTSSSTLVTIIASVVVIDAYIFLSRFGTNIERNMMRGEAGGAPLNENDRITRLKITNLFLMCLMALLLVITRLQRVNLVMVGVGEG